MSVISINGQNGWACPVCGKVFAPTITECPYCGEKNPNSLTPKYEDMEAAPNKHMKHLNS